jgi:SAM-dependent methyltransferase
MSSEDMRFGFGKNWGRFIKKHFSEERIENSRQHLLNFLQMSDLHGKSFLDIGCGSGLHSFAALRAGASKILSFDYDPVSVKTTLKLKGYAGHPVQWQVMQGSILEDAFLRTLEPADIVYSWGVLHHTGNMWMAMDNAARLIKPGGLFYVALYDFDICENPPPEFWLEVKCKYNRSKWPGKRKMELWYIWRFILCNNLFRIPLFLIQIAGYKQRRGMALYTDIVDWLGGWPMEFAKRIDVKAWAECQNLETVIMKTGEANTEYLFRRRDEERKPGVESMTQSAGGK